MSRICFITPGFGSIGGGISSVVSTLSNSFISNGHEVSIIFLHKTADFFHLDPKIKLLEPPVKQKKTLTIMVYF
jgi:hypothetical protein